METFEEWMESVNRACQAIAGVSIHDLPDCLFRDWYDTGFSSHKAAWMALRQAGFFLDEED